MKNYKLLLTLIILLAFSCWLIPSDVMADGKFYAHPDRVPPKLPYQRAIISYQDGQELLILQSKFEGEGKDFGWVIPLPNQPKIASMTEDDARMIFQSLSYETKPTYVEVSSTIWLVLTLLCLIWLTVMFIYLIIGFICVLVKRSIPTMPRLFRINPAIPAVLLFILLCAGMGIPSTLGKSAGIDELSSQKVGVFDVKVIKASNSSDLIAWLNEHQYKFTPEDANAFNSYIKQGWCFVTARINQEELSKDEYRSYDNMVNPLMLYFPTKEAVYPLSLTATIGSETEILLYVIGSDKMDGGNRFEMEFAGYINSANVMLKYLDLILKTETKENLALSRSYGKYVTKLRAKLLPEQMKEDLILKPATDYRSYRKSYWR